MLSSVDEFTKEEREQIKVAIKYCMNPNGGFGGGYLQQPHLAPTYASFLSILVLGEDAFDLIDR